MTENRGQVHDLPLRGQADKLFSTSHYPMPFSFNSDVADVFDDMVNRSIPLYRDVNMYLLEWARRFYQRGTALIDIGCSTGTCLSYLAQNLEFIDHLVGIDQSAPMIEKARSKLAEAHVSSERLSLICDDISACELPESSFVIMNYTLQFLPLNQRQQVLNRIWSCLRPGGVLFMSEKLRSDSPLVQQTITQIYESFKSQQGYTQTEIARKKAALENVMISFSEADHRKYLEQAGFQTIESVLKWNNFISFVAIKEF